MFDPWIANVSEMEDAQVAWLASGKKAGPHDPASQFWAVANVCAYRPNIVVINGLNELTRDPGDAGRNILWCVRACLSHGIIAPDWLASEFARCFDAVFNAEVGSWSDPLAFGSPYPKGTNLTAWRKGLINGPKVVAAVEAILKSDPKTAIDKGLFERVGKPLGLGSTLAEELYYDFRMHIPLPKSARIKSTKSLPQKPKN